MALFADFQGVNGDSLVAQMLKNLPAMQESQVRSVGPEDPLEEGIYSCLENPMDRGAWQATVHRVPQNWA